MFKAIRLICVDKRPRRNEDGYNFIIIAKKKIGHNLLLRSIFEITLAGGLKDLLVIFKIKALMKLGYKRNHCINVKNLVVSTSNGFYSIIC